MALRDLLRRMGLNRNHLTEVLLRSVSSKWYLATHLASPQRRSIVRSGDPVRYGTVHLALEQLLKDHVMGSLAECGVYQGSMSKFIHEHIPDRPLYLFDTFRGFDSRDSNTNADDRFKDTSLEAVLSYLGKSPNIIIREGFFPHTISGLEDERFSFVMVDFDKYEPTSEALKFFYPRTNTGGFIFVHDYNNPESDWACSRALNEFLLDKKEKLISIPDAWGSALIRKI